MSLLYSLFSKNKTKQQKKKTQENQKIQGSLFPTPKIMQGDFITKKYFKSGGKLQ